MEVLSKNKIKWINSLRLKKNRDSEQSFVIEGEKIVREVLANWPTLIQFICTTNEDLLVDSKTFLTDRKTMGQISEMKSVPDIIAVVSYPAIKEGSGLVLVLDGVQDPGNMGTIVRTADWFGVSQIICSKDTVDIYNNKVVQSTMGSLFRVKVSYTNIETYLTGCNLPIYGALLDGEDYRKVNLQSNAVLVMGNEGNGISSAVMNHINSPILIPRLGDAESLNVAIATGILLAAFKL